MSIEAMKLARAIEYLSELDNVPSEIIHDLQAIEQAEKQEPVAWINWNAATGERTVSFVQESELASEPLYNAPPPRQPLTDEEILAIARNHYNPYQRAEISFSRAIEATHGIKGEA